MFFAVGARWRWSVDASRWALRALSSHWGCSVPKVRPHHYHKNDKRRPKYRTPPFAGVIVRLQSGFLFGTKGVPVFPPPRKILR